MVVSTPQTIVYGGPSLAMTDDLKSRFDVRPPIKRDDLSTLARERSPGTVLVVDGLFGQDMAVTVTECRELLDLGWTVLGASSMGALRAAELYSVGMQGVGTVYDMLRLGTITDDSELAVAYQPGTYREITVSLVQIRMAVAQGIGDLDDDIRQLALESARQVHYLERSVSCLRDTWKGVGIPPYARDLWCSIFDQDSMHPKRSDAEYAIRLLTCTTWPLSDRSR